MAAADAAEYFDEPLKSYCREFTHGLRHTPATVAAGGFLIVRLASRRYHAAECGDELV